jgi:hypothetical protein
MAMAAYATSVFLRSDRRQGYQTLIQSKTPVPAVFQGGENSL